MGSLGSLSHKNIIYIILWKDFQTHVGMTAQQSSTSKQRNSLIQKQSERTEKIDFNENHPSEIQTESCFSRTKILINEKSQKVFRGRSYFISQTDLEVQISSYYSLACFNPLDNSKKLGLLNFSGLFWIKRPTTRLLSKTDLSQYNTK